MPLPNLLPCLAGVAFALNVTMALPARACEGQVGKVIFEDNFEDDSGGWDLSPPVTSIQPPEFLIAVNKKTPSMPNLNLTFHAVDGDFCMEAVLPPPTAPGGTRQIGIEFWAVDYDDVMLATLSSEGNVGLHSHDKLWQTVFRAPATAEFKAGENDVNALRVIVKAGRITVLVNGTPIKTVRAQTPQGKLRFGIYGQFADFDKAVDGSPPIRVKSFKVTTGE